MNYYWCLLMLNRNSAANSFGKSLLWLVAAPTLVTLATVFESEGRLWAQTPTPLQGVEIPTSLEPGTTLNIESSEAMRTFNEALQSRFSQQYSDADVAVDYKTADEAVQAVIDGQADLAAIGRGLTDEELQAGLQQVPLSRHKIAIVIGPSNPFNGSLTVDQFAQIFRGEITNWSQVGGPDAPIVLIDRPVVSDTRQAFRNYPAFQNAPFEAASGATSLTEDSTTAVTADLGDTGIGYAIAEQALNNPEVKIVPMHETLPDDQRYPFSQPLAYVYQANNPSPAALAFLGFAVNPDNEAVIEAARAETAQVPETTPEPTPAATAEAVTPTPAATPPVTGRTRGVPWWPWLLALPILGALLWWLLKDRAPVVAPVVADANRRIILTPRDCQNAYAYWELPESEVDAMRRQNYAMAIKLHDVTDIADVDRQAPHSTQQFPCDTVATGDLHMPVAVDNRDYLVELGYLDGDDAWHALARSAHVRVPACPSIVTQSVAGVGAAAAGAAGLAAVAATHQPMVVAEPKRIILTPRDCRSAYAYWELPQSEVDDLGTGHRALKVRLYDVTELPGHWATGHNSLQEFDGDLVAKGDLHLPIAVDDRDYLVEVGYVDGSGQWQPLAKSDPVRVPACPEPVGAASGAAAAAGLTNPMAGTGQGLANLGSDVSNRTADLTNTVGDLGTGLGNLAGAAAAGGVAAAAGLGATARSWLDRASGSVPEMGSGIGNRVDLGAESKIILVPQGRDAAYAYWEAAGVHKAALKSQGGRVPVLRIHDATNLELDHQPPHGTQEYLLQETDQDQHVVIPVPDRDYVAELGYLTDDGQWLQLVRSLHVRIPTA
ncbi:MAG: DUF4912 domain-containing protein [Nodosilinea sp.]